MADDLESTNLTGIVHMGPNAGTSVIIPYPHYSESLGSIFRQLAQIYQSSCMFSCHEFCRDIQTSSDYLIDLSFDLSYLVRSRLRFKYIITL